MERILIGFLVFSVIVAVVVGYGNIKTEEFHVFASEFENQLESNGTTKFLDDVFHEQMTTEFKLFKYTDRYKKLDKAYAQSVEQEKRFFENLVTK